MRTLRRIAATFRRWLSPDRAERELHEEMQSYAELRAEELRAAGMSTDEAYRRARMELGGIEQVKESVRAGRAGAAIEQTLQDMHYAMRGLRRTPGFTAAAVLTLALGVGVNTAVFSVVNATLLRPLPYDHPEQLVELGHLLSPGSPEVRTFFGLGWREIEFWRGEHAIFGGVEAYRPPNITAVNSGNGSVVQLSYFTAGLPGMLGVVPRLGRVFTAQEAAEQAPVVVISEDYWRTAMGGGSVVGTMLVLDGVSRTIIGVMPRTMRWGPGGGGTTQIWAPLTERWQKGGPGFELVSPVFRLRQGSSIASAKAAAMSAAARLQTIAPEREAWQPEMIPFDRRQAGSIATLESPLFSFLAMAGLVLLVACANVANLLTVRSLARRQEILMRRALGATRLRLVRLLAAEGAVLAITGGAIGLALGVILARLLPVLTPSRLRFSLFAVHLPELDLRLFLFASGVTVVVAVLASVVPAMRGAHSGALAEAADPGRFSGRTPYSRRAAIVLQVLQMALALVLVTAAGLIGTSLATSLRVNLGFNGDRLLNMSLELPRARYSTIPEESAYFSGLLDRLRAMPGISHAALGTPPPMTGGGRIVVREQEHAPAVSAAIRSRLSRGYFETVGIPLIEGRDFADSDDRLGFPVAIVDRSAAERLWPGRSAIGQQFRYSPYVPWHTVIGIVADVKGYDFRSDLKRYGVYLPLIEEQSIFVTLLVRARGDTDQALRDVEALVRATDPDIKMTSAGLVLGRYEQMETFAGPRFFTALASVFALLALITSSVGLYGLLSYSVGQRQREIGVRMALGSTPTGIRSLVFREAMIPVAVGGMTGGVAAWLSAGYLSSLTYGVGPHDVRVFAVSAVVLLLGAFVATIGPVRKATSVDPIRALRAE